MTPPLPETTGPKQVTKFEATLLRILRCILRQYPAAEAMSLIEAKLDPPAALSPNCIHLIRDSISKGVVLLLVRSGGWKRERFLRQGDAREGRLWQRSPLADRKLTFSKKTVEFLVWLTARVPADTSTQPNFRLADLTPGDQLIVFLAYEVCRTQRLVNEAMRNIQLFVQHPLCWLFYPEDFAKWSEVPTFEPWTVGLRSLILEGLQANLTDRWLQMERNKGQVGDWTTMLQQGRVQGLVLDLYSQAIEKAGRLDLMRFCLIVLGKILAGPHNSASFWTGGLQGNGPPRLADRLATQRAALSFLRHAERLQQWEQTARTRGFYDEEYQAAKFWLSEWERLNGSELTTRAERVVQQVEPLRTP